MPRRTIIPRSFTVLVFPFLIGLTVLLFLTNCTFTPESSDPTPAPLTSTPPVTEIDLPWDQPPDHRIVYFVAQGAVPADSLMAPALLERSLGVQTVRSWDDVIRLHDETPLDALIVHESAAPVVDREWMATAYRRGLVVAGFNVTGPELAELVQDPSVESLGFASDPYGAPFFVITYELQTGRGSGRGRTTNTLDTPEIFELFARTLVGDIEGVARIRERSDEEAGRNVAAPTATDGSTLTPAPDVPSPAPPPTTMPANALSTHTPAATTTPSRAATATTTPAPTWTAVRDTSRRMCRYDRWSPEKLPNLEALRWELLKEDVRHLPGFEYRPVALNAAPDGTAVAIMLQSGGLESSLAMIDVQANEHWWWARETYHTINSGFDRWLPDGRLLYIEDGQVRVGTRDNWHGIEAPAAMAGIHYAANGVAFATEAETNEWWRLDLSAEEWERVPNAIPGQEIHVAQDGSYVAGFDWINRLWRAPVEMGSGGAQVVSLDTEDVEYLGSGRTPLPPVHLANSHYWRLDTWEARMPRMLLGGRYGVDRRGMIVNDRTGERITRDDLPVPARYNHDARYTVPPDGEWLAIDLWEISETEPHRIVSHGIYVSPSDSLTAGTRIGVLNGVEVAGWVTEPEAIVVQTRPTDTLAVAPLPLTSQTNPIPLDGAGELRTTVRGGIVTTDATQPARLLLYNLDGAVIDTLDLSDRYDVIERAFATGNRVYLTATDEDPNNCTYGLVEWTVPTANQRTGEKE